jgi:glycogen(starch) synthase
MKILMTVDAVGGVWTYAVELCRALAAHDVEVVLACMGPAPDASQLDSVHRMRNVRIESCGYALEWMADPWADIELASEWLLQLADSERIDVVHLNGYVLGSLPWSRPVIVVAHSCVYSWWQAVHGCEPPPDWQTYRERVAAGLRSADCVVAPTRAFLESVRALYAFTGRSAVIHNARTTARGVCPPDAQRLPIVLAAGRIWDRAKGIDVLDAASRELSWHVYVAGSAVGTEQPRLQLSAVRHLGNLRTDDLEAWLQRAAIFAHAARYEPFGLAPLEAALGGCALLLADLPTLRELWDGAAEFVPAGDATSLHRELEQLIGNPERLHRLAQAAWKRAQRYRPHVMCKQYLALYRELVSGAPQLGRAVA